MEMKKIVFCLLIIVILVIASTWIISNKNPTSPKFSKGTSGRSSPPLKSAGNLYPQSAYCKNVTEYTLQTSQNVQLDKVCILNVGRQNYKTIPAEVFKFTNLSVLILNDNPITSVKGIEKLQYLTDLELANAQLTEFPTEATGLKHLQVLSLYGNRIENIPAEIGELKELRVFNLSKNPISSISEGIRSLTKLEWLELRGNTLTSQDRNKLIKLLPHADIEFEYQEGL